MHQKNPTILFVVSSTKTNQKGLCPLNCRITLYKVRKQFSTGLFVSPSNWTNKIQAVKGKDSNSIFLNSQINQIRDKIQNIILVFQLEKHDYSLDDIYKKYLGENLKRKEHIISYCKKYLSRLKKLVGLEIKENTYQKFEYVLNHLEAFVKFKFKSNDYAMEQLDLQFLNDFEYYLKTEKRQKQITINKTIQRLRTPIKLAISDRILDRDPFLLYKSKKVQKEIIFLTTEELEKLKDYNFQQERLSKVRDLYIFCCYTGLAFLEMSTLEVKHIQKGFDGMDWIQMKREKTQKNISIPILPKAKELINKYYDGSEKKIFCTISNQKFNSYLKEITTIVGIEKILTHHTARKTFASTVLLYNDIPMEIVSELLGHSNMTTTQESYGKVIRKKVSEEMTKLNIKLFKNEVNDL
jgi:integrase